MHLLKATQSLVPRIEYFFMIRMKEYKDTQCREVYHKFFFSTRYCGMPCTMESYLLDNRKGVTIVGYADYVILVVVAKHITKKMFWFNPISSKMAEKQ